MGQIVGLNAKCKRANLNALGSIPTPANGEIILVSSDNSMTADGQGDFDCYIKGNGTTAASLLPLQSINKSKILKKIPVTWEDNYYVDSSNALVSSTGYRAAQNIPVGDYDRIYANVVVQSSPKIVLLNSEMGIITTLSNVTLPTIDIKNKYPNTAYISFSNNYIYSGDLYGITLPDEEVWNALSEYIAIGDRQENYIRTISSKLYIEPEFKKGAYIRGTNNTLVTDSYSQYSDYIAIPTQATKVLYSGKAYGSVAGVVFFDKYKNKISHWTSATNAEVQQYSVDIPSTAFFCRVSSSTSLLKIDFDEKPSFAIENFKLEKFQKIDVSWTNGAYINASNVVTSQSKCFYIHNYDISAHAGMRLVAYANPSLSSARNLILDENENILLSTSSILDVNLSDYPTAKYISLTNNLGNYSGEIFVETASDETVQNIVSDYYAAFGENAEYIKEIANNFYIAPKAEYHGAYLNANNYPETYSSAVYSVYYLLPPKATKVYYTGVSYGSARGVLFFDKHKTLISAIAVGTNSTPVSNVEVTIPSGSVFYRISSMSAACNLTFDAPTTPVGGNGGGTQDLSNYLYGKKYVAIGDSFTDTIGSETIEEGPLAGMSKVYPYIIANRNNMQVLNQGASGTVLNNYLADARYNAIPEDVDYITIWYGINDGNYNIEVGTASDQPDSVTSATSTTTCGGFNYFFKWLLTNRPYAKIGCIITDYSTEARRHGIIDCCKKWGIAYLDLMGNPNIPMFPAGRDSNISVASEAITLRANAFNVNGTTNIHPSNKMHEWQSSIIENFMRSL